MTDENAITTEEQHTPDGAVQLQGFKIRNIMKIKEVTVTVRPGETTTFGGKNDQGKTAILRSLWMGLGGKSAIFDDAIRHGETTGDVWIDVNAYTVYLVLTIGKAPRFEVRRKDGTLVTAPMALLRQWMGKIGFDPLEFKRMDSKQQSKALMDLVGLDFTADDRECTRIAGERVIVGRTVKSLKGQLDGLPKAEAPDDLVSITELLAERTALVQKQQARDVAIAEAAHLMKSAADFERFSSRKAEQIADLEETIASLRGDLDSSKLNAKAARDEADATKIPDEVSTDAIDEQIDNAEQTNEGVRQNQAREAVVVRHKAAVDEYAAHTDQLAEINKKKLADLASAKFPVEGLGVKGDDNVVVFNGSLFKNESDSTQIRVSVELALHNSGELKLAILDGAEAFDAEHLQLVKGIIEESGGNLVAAMVSDSKDCSFIIEEGEIKDND